MSDDIIISNLKEIGKDLDNLKEVLRDDYKFKIEKLPDNELKKHYETLLEKLDGKTELTTVVGTKVYTEVVADIIKNDKETEKKECFHIWQDIFDDDRQQCVKCEQFREKDLKASGGEPKHICDGHYDLNYRCSICGKHISEPPETLKDWEIKKDLGELEKEVE